jgi:hypothetical protein
MPPPSYYYYYYYTTTDAAVVLFEITVFCYIALTVCRKLIWVGTFNTLKKNRQVYEGLKLNLTLKMRILKQ